MKKVLIIIAFIIIIKPVFVLGVNYDVDATGTQDKPHPVSSTGTCTDSSYYWISFSGDDYKHSGLRVSFYDTNTGKQIGRTVDVYNWGSALDYTDPDYKQIKDDNLTNKYGFDTWKKVTNHTYYYSKVDYASNNLKSAETGNSSDDLVYGDYIFYFDREAYKLSEFTSCSCKYRKYDHYIYAKEFAEYFMQKYNYKYKCSTGQYYICSSDKGGAIKDGPLFYTVQNASKQTLKNYFRTPEVVKRYLHLAHADELIDIEVGEYQMLLEPVQSLTTCTSSAYSGYYTVSDLGYIYKKIKKVNFNDSTKRWPGKLAISSNATISGYTFKATNVLTSKGSERYFEPNEFYTPNKSESGDLLGIGMAVVNGKEVCYPHCKSSTQKYKIVYRTIDLNNPFLGLDGKSRTIEKDSNWYENEKTINAKIYQGTPIYTVTLGPTKMKEIRKDTSKINYLTIMSKYKSGDTFANSKFKKDFGL